MSRFREAALSLAGLALLAMLPAGHALAAGNVEAGEKVFRKCKACHQIGINAGHRIGPQLNDIIGRQAGSLEDFSYSGGMSGSDVVWSEETLAQFLASPRDMFKGTRMTFAGLREQADIDDVIAYLATYASTQAGEPVVEEMMAASNASPLRDDGAFGLGRLATGNEVAAWDIDVRPDGAGLPEGSGNVEDGEIVFADNCAICHGDFAEGVGRWPVLAGGQDTLTDDRPVKTIGSYWPYLSTVWDYVNRAMPFGNAQTLEADDVYAITAYLLYMNDLVDDDFELSRGNFLEVRLPNEDNFLMDDREETEAGFVGGEVCMENCRESVEITSRAQVLDVTPEENLD